MKVWGGKDLKGEWLFTVKLDGVNATWDGEKFVSRRNKPLHNVNHLADVLGVEKGEVYEVFCGNVKRTRSILRRSKNDSELVSEFEMFDIEPDIDPRLMLVVLKDPTQDEINLLIRSVLGKGYEGLVLRGPNGERLKVLEEADED